jgi:hypothetical protein
MFTFAKSMCVFAFATGGLFAQAVSAPAQQTYTFAMLGVAEGQTVRLNVLNEGFAPPTGGSACSGRLTFLDAKGTAIKSEVVNVAPGQSMSYDLFSDRDLAIAVNERVEIRATVATPALFPPSTTPPVPAPCKLIGTLEVFDTLTGRTQAVIEGMHVVPTVVATPVATPGVTP